MDVTTMVDPEIATALAGLPIDAAALRLEDLPQLRETAIAMWLDVALSDDVERTDHEVPGDPPVTVRLHRPRLGGARPCVYWIHGGGYIVGDYRMNDPQLDRWCRQFDCAAVSVEYRLAPEHPYPAPLEDCYAGLRWVADHAGELGVDATRIGIAGASAGAGLAAALALLARDRGEVTPAFQLLLYPMLDDRQVTASSTWEVPVWPPSANRLGWQAYLGELYGHDVPQYAAPGRATDLSGLPPTFVLVGAVDGFLDEDVEYAQSLLHAGVPTELHVYPGCPHGFDALAPGTALSERAVRDTDEWLRSALQGARA